MENNIPEMDILRMPTSEERIVGRILNWVVSAKPDSDKIAFITFKKNTPAEIFDLYKRNFDLIPFPAHKKYLIEK